MSVVGLYGKVPSQGDFLRADATGPAAQALITWLHEAIEPVHRAGLALPAEPVRFLLHGAGSSQAVVGSMIASQDRVCRHFPLCAFAFQPSASLGRTFPALPAAAAEFCAGAEAALSRSRELFPPALTQALRNLPPPRDPREVEPDLARAAAERPLHEVLSSAYAGLPTGASAYGLSTLLAAVRPVRGNEALRTTLALDGIARDDVERFVWLELLRRALSWPVPPSIFWTRERLLISLGPPPATLLQHLCDPSRPPAKIWPLRSDRAEAIATARRGLPEEALRLIDLPAGTAMALPNLASTLGGDHA